jgi:hypothetical protein
MVNATSVAAAASRRRRSLLQSAAAPISLQSEVHALEADVGDVQPRMQAAVADGSLASMLQGIGLTLVPDSGACLHLLVAVWLPAAVGVWCLPAHEPAAHR